VTLLVMERFYSALRAGRAPAAALRDAQVAVRELTGRDLVATIERWRAENPDRIATLEDLPAQLQARYDERIYADPQYWAPFMLIGKPD
jgi:CHAT domain-containing protein